MIGCGRIYSGAMAVDKFAPVIVGAHQIVQKPDDPSDAVEPVALMAAAVEGALSDSSASSLAQDIDIIAVVEGAWKYSDPARLVADRIGARSARTMLSSNGGHTPQSLMNHLSSRIQSGEIASAVIVGAETIWSRRRLRRADLPVNQTVQIDVEPDEQFGNDVPMSTEFEQSRGLKAPINYYPIFESAIRAKRGETLDQHRNRISELWAGFNQVAVDNQHAWSRDPMTAAEIRDPARSNRMVGFPYTKAMNSNWDLDQASALVLCSAEKAEAAGVNKDLWVFPWAGTDAHDTYSVSERRDLHSSPAIAEAGKALFEMTDVGADDIAHIDLYSCFPAAVQVAVEALELSFDRSLTQTGGLTFAGGPLNNYVTHSLAAMTQTLRSATGDIGLVTANGGYLTKHALGIYSTTPPSKPFKAVDVQEIVDQVPTTTVDEGFIGTAEVEAYTVMHSKEGPDEALCAVRTPTGQRTWAQIVDADDLEAMMATEAIESPITVDAEGLARLA